MEQQDAQNVHDTDHRSEGQAMRDLVLICGILGILAAFVIPYFIGLQEGTIRRLGDDAAQKLSEEN